MLKATTVVNVRERNVSYDVYIGQRFGTFSASIYANPYSIGTDGNRRDVIEKFAAYWYAQEQATLRHKAVEQLAGKVLGCWCSPNTCHGSIIAGYVNWKANEDENDSL